MLPGPDASGELVAGLAHLDPALDAWSAPAPATRHRVTEDALARVAARAAAARTWSATGDREVVGLEVTAGSDLGLPGGTLPPSATRTTAVLGTRTRVRGEADPARLWPAPLMTGALCGGAGAAVGAVPGVLAGVGSAALVAGAVGVARYRSSLAALRRAAPLAPVAQLAAVLADALLATGATSRGADGLVVVPRGGDAVRVELAGVPREESQALADALDELLAPLAEPTWLVSRPVVATPAAEADRRRTARRCALGRAVDAALAWHAVPALLAGDEAGRAALQQAWQARLGRTRLLPADSVEGREVLDLLRGTDPFGVRARHVLRWS